MVGRPGVLFVGDDDVASSHLAGSGFRVERVEGHEAALTALSEGEFDCVVTVGTDGTGATDNGTGVAGPSADAADESAGVVEAVRRLREVRSDLPVVLYVDEETAAAARGVVAAGVADLVRRTGDDHARLLGRVRNAVARRQAVRRAERQARLNEVIRELNQELVRADGRSAVEDSVCEVLARSGQYEFAWIGAVEGDSLTLRTMGVEDGTVEGRGAVSADRGTAFAGAIRRAAESREVVVVRNATDRGAWEAALDRPFSSVAAVPFVYESEDYGVLVLYADRVGAFDEDERGVLAELGENVAHAIDALDVRRTLALRGSQLRRQNERLERFASVVSHDLRNPLNVAQGYVEAVREAGDDDVAGFADEVDASLDRMETIVADVLELARQGERIEDPGTVALDDVAAAAWRNVETGDASLDAAGLTVRADGSRLSQLLENLFRNAREHGDAGAVRVVPLRDEDPAGDGTDGAPSAPVGFAVEDDGSGIPPDDREDVLEMGHSGSDDGTGFGLAIVDEIASAHGWAVTVTDGSGAPTADDGRFDGARFEFAGVDVVDGDAEESPD